MDGKIIVTLGGEQRIIKYNTYALIALSKIMGTETKEVVAKVMEMSTEHPLRALAFLIYAGMMGWFEATAHYTHGIELPNVTMWVAEADETELLSVWNTFMDATGTPKASDAAVKEYEEHLKKNSNLMQKKAKRKRKP